MTTLAVSGALGRMGGRVIALAHESPDLRVVTAIEREGHPLLGQDPGPYLGIGPLGATLAADLSTRVDVLIDFSSPDATMQRLQECIAHRTAFLVGTTGLTEDQMSRIRQAASAIPCLVSPNMSVGVNVLYQIVSEAARLLGAGYDVEVIEAHHRFKKDAPSGTALRIARVIAAALGRDVAKDCVYGRHATASERSGTEIGIHAVRAGDIVGDHTVIFSNLGERLEITHRAHSRDTFARGALRAAKFLAQAKPGFYHIDEALGLNQPG